jgi:hypothetical protein
MACPVVCRGPSSLGTGLPTGGSGSVCVCGSVCVVLVVVVVVSEADADAVCVAIVTLSLPSPSSPSPPSSRTPVHSREVGEVGRNTSTPLDMGMANGSTAERKEGGRERIG